MVSIPRQNTFAISDDWLFVESRALRKKLLGIKATASTYTGPRDVPVHFINPDFELVTADYPGIYITYGEVNRAPDREHRGRVALQYAPPGYPTDVMVPADMADKDSSAMVDWGDEGGFDPLSSPYIMEETPIPYNLEFQIAVLTRNYQQAFEIMQQLSREERLHERWGFLEVPEDGTIRTLELTSGPDVSVIQDENSKRLVQTLYSVRVTAELNTELAPASIVTSNRVSEVNVVLETTVEL